MRPPSFRVRRGLLGLVRCRHGREARELLPGNCPPRPFMALSYSLAPHRRRNAKVLSSFQKIKGRRLVEQYGSQGDHRIGNLGVYRPSAFSRIATISLKPRLFASVSGVSPERSARLTLAPASTSALSVATWRLPPSPSRIDSITAVQPRLLTWSSGAFAAINVRTTSSWPRCAAAISAVP